MAKRVRHHVNPLSLRYLEFTPEPVITLPENKKIEVELGCAEGEFLFNRANDTDDNVFIIGIEIRKKLVDKINKKSKEMGLSHKVVAIFANINMHIPQLFPPGSVDAFFFNFPDPWFKFSQKKRRVVSKKVVKDLVTSLSYDGKIFFQSDVFDIALDAMYSFEVFGTPPLINKAGEWSFYHNNPYKTMSRRERYVTEMGKKVWRILYSLH